MFNRITLIGLTGSICALGACSSAEPETTPETTTSTRVTGVTPVEAPAGLDPAVALFRLADCRSDAPSPGQFTDARERLGIDFVHQPDVPDPELGTLTNDYSGVALADFDGDRSLDVYFANAGADDRLYLTGGRGPGAFVATDQGRSSWVAVPVDLDGDGDLDIAATQEIAYWLANDGGGVFKTQIPITPGTDAEEHLIYGYSAGDLNGDDRLELLVSLHEMLPAGSEQEMPAKEWLFGSGTSLENLTSAVPDRRVEDWTFLSALVDLDDDGDLDIYEFNDAFSLAVKGIDPDDWERQGNRIYRNDGVADGRPIFTDLSDSSDGAVIRTAMGGAFGDYDNDGLLDIYVTTMRPEANALLHNEGELGFKDVTFDLNADTLLDEHDVGWGAAFVDVDADGWLDLYVLHGWLIDFDYEIGPQNELRQANTLLRNTGGTGFEVVANSGLENDGWSRSPAVGDLDRDGFPDIIVGNADGAAGVYLNGCDNRPTLTVSLRQAGENPYAVGARVRVVGGGMTQTRHIRAGGDGLYGGGPPEAYLGFASGTDSVDIEVRWPDGTHRTYSGIPTRHYVEITK